MSKHIQEEFKKFIGGETIPLFVYESSVEAHGRTLKMLVDVNAELVKLRTEMSKLKKQIEDKKNV